ncbi:MAG: hypothetical protein WHV63_01985 [Ignavibacteria bacterium]
MKTLGIVGTAKNTGKTTTLSYILNGFQSQKLKVAVTGIGYDGEEFDNITNLPKPRIFFKENSVIITSEKCIQSSKLDFELIEKTPFRTALGEILIVRLIEAGKVVVAGPNTTKGLTEIKYLIERKTDTELLIVDGSLNRITPMSIVDRLIFTTGASRSQNIDQLVKEMIIIERLFNYPKYSIDFFQGEFVQISTLNGLIKLNLNSLVDKSDFLEIKKFLDHSANKIFIPGLTSTKILIELIDTIKLSLNRPIQLIFYSPLQILLTDDLFKISELIERCEINKIDIAYIYKPELAAITINPFYPKPENFSFKPAYINKDELFEKMSTNLRTPVFNILEANANKIFELI